ncbi:GNAT family N-acetyltransferase [Kitasatospora cineracea]|uniref:GNAT family N-acetyltransferase n=1 Tax=Kitasatospora cineracea TaxID=88074 RepID=UPI00341601EF
MTSEDLLTRSRRLWAGLAAVPTDYRASTAGATVLVSPDSGLCPPGWVGVVVLGGTALITAPTERSAERLRRAAVELPPAALGDPERLGRLVPLAQVLGPANLAYLDATAFTPVEPAQESYAVAELTLDESAVQSLLARASEADRAECGLAEVTSPVFALRDGDQVIAATGYRTWRGGAAHLSVLTDAAHRSRGLARATASAAVAHALAAGLLPQWRARPAASRRVAAALGFRDLGVQLSCKPAD